MDIALSVQPRETGKTEKRLRDNLKLPTGWRSFASKKITIFVVQGQTIPYQKKTCATHTIGPSYIIFSRPNRRQVRAAESLETIWAKSNFTFLRDHCQSRHSQSHAADSSSKCSVGAAAAEGEEESLCRCDQLFLDANCYDPDLSLWYPEKVVEEGSCIQQNLEVRTTTTTTKIILLVVLVEPADSVGKISPKLSLSI